MNKKEAATQTTAMIVRKVPTQLRRDFKSRCAQEGKTQQDKIIEMMGGYVENARL